MGTNDRSLNIVGESFRNPDGTSRQAEIKRCKPGEPVTLRREPTNKHDPMAAAVDSARGVQIGYVSADHTVWIGGKLDKGSPVCAIVKWISGGEPGKPSRGVCIRVSFDGSEPDRPQAAGWLARLFGR